MSSLPQMPAGMLSGTPALKPAQPDEPPGRAIDDPALVRRAIFDKALLTVQELPPVTSSTHTLRLRNAAYEGPDNVGMREYKRALLSGDTLARRLRADVELVDNVSGNVLDARRTTLAAIPYYTDAGVFINKGTKYAMANQQRLRAGAYTRTRDNGEVETHINVPPGQGAPFRVFLDPATGVFKARVGQAQIPLVPMLQSLGVTEQDMRGAWGAKLTTANIAKVRGGDLSKLYTRLVRSGKSQTEPEQMAEIRQLLENTRLDPDVTRHTLNKPIERVDADALLTTTRKLLAIHNRKNPEMLKELGLEPADQDDRDHLAFMRLLGPEDITAERLRTAPKVLRPLLWKAGRTGKLDHVAPGALTRLVQDAILGSGLGQATEDINPLQVFEQQLRVTRMGVGGIPSSDSVPDSSRSVQPSHAGYIDPIVTPESQNAGIDVRLGRLTRKGNDGELYSKFHDMRTGTAAWKQPKELFDSVIAFSTARPPRPDQPFDTASYVKFRNALDRGEIVQSKSGKYFAQGMQRGQLDYYPIEQVDYAIPHMEDTFSPTANLVPGKSGMKGQRVAMGARMLTQALPLVDAEAPLVQSGVPGSSGSFESLYGERMGALKAKQGGRVLGVSEDSITVQYDDGRKDEIELARHVPGARKTYTHQDPVVTPGARFEPGQLLARSNFTDKNGTAALGRNLRTAWMPLKGYNYEDAVVLSESGAKKLTSQHMYKTSVDIDKDTDKIGLAPYRGMFPKRFNAAQLEKVDEHGVVRVGQRVESGDPLVLMANERRGRVGEVSRAGSSRWRDAAETWEHDQPGIVTDVAKTKNGVVVAVKSIVPMQVGDKLASRFGSKGVIAAILPDDEMPRNEAGEPIELAVNDLGITTRTNPIQAIEAVLGKVALKRGEPYHLHDFNDIADLRAFAMKEAERYGVKGAEDLLDPETGKSIPRVMTGQHFIMKLHHVAESKVSGRSFGSYTADHVPAKGGPEGAKTWGMLHLNAILSHGAVNVAKDGHMVRGQRNPQYWAAVMAGKTPPDPPVPPVYRKFIAQLQASGIHPVREGTRTHLMAMTNAGIKELAGDREVTSPDTVDWNDDGMTPIRGGLFDESLFGGIDGERWAKISLPEPLPNPVMEEPIRRVLGLTGPQFERIIAGQEQLDGATGSRAIAAALGKVNVDAEIERAAREIRGTRKTARDAATRRVGFLLGARKTGVSPSDWMWDSVPVMPPRWRPVSRMQGTDAPMVADANYLYRDLFENKRNFEQLQGQVSDVGDERLALYQSMRAVTGLGDPAPEHLKEQKIKGAMQHIIGSSPKFGVVQRRLLGSQTDLVGRGTIVPNPDLDMDQVGIPEDQAWQVYRPFLVRHMAKRGVAPGRAAEMVANRTDIARRALTDVMAERPVLLDRAPVLHRFGVMAFWPRIAKGNQIELTPIVTKGFGADFDGDAMQFHVPGSDKAVTDAVEKMMPSSNLRAPADFKVHQLPQQEYLAGLYRATHDRKNAAPIQFPTTKAMLAALSRGEISHDQPVVIEES
jgi:DNA-directed RNA polymerase beta subunit